MTLTDADLGELADLAVAAAVEAGRMIERSRPAEVQHKAGGATLASQVVTDIDRQSESIIVDRLAPTLQRFELGLLTEERDDDGGRFSTNHFWCIDPLDGTLPFIEGAPGYAVSIALVGIDGTPKIGVVYDPVRSLLVHAIAGAGVFQNHERWTAPSQRAGEVLSVFADRSFVANANHEVLMAGLDEVAQAMGLSGVRLDATAGAVMNACGVLTNPPACYFKQPGASGGGSLWDFSATACLFREAGAVATDIRGRALDLNRPDATNMAHRGVLFATDEALAAQIRALCAQPDA